MLGKKKWGSKNCWDKNVRGVKFSDGFETERNVSGVICQE